MRILKHLEKKTIHLLIAISLLGGIAHALMIEEFGDTQSLEVNLPHFPGVTKLLNNDHRIYTIEVNGTETAYYYGSNDKLKEVLGEFAELEYDKVLVLDMGPRVVHSFGMPGVFYRSRETANYSQAIMAGRKQAADKHERLEFSAEEDETVSQSKTVRAVEDTTIEEEKTRGGQPPTEYTREHLTFAYDWQILVPGPFLIRAKEEEGQACPVTLTIVLSERIVLEEFDIPDGLQIEIRPGEEDLLELSQIMISSLITGSYC